MLGENELSDLVLDSQEILDKAEAILIQLEKSLTESTVDADKVNSLFRYFHTLKGNAGFFNFNVIVNLSHSAESLLEIVRNDNSLLDQKMIQLFMEARDTLYEIFSHLNENKTDTMYKEKADTLIPRLFYIKENLKAESSEPKKEEPRFGIFKKKIVLSDTPITEEDNKELPVSNEPAPTPENSESDKLDKHITERATQENPVLEKKIQNTIEANNGNSNGQATVKRDIRIETEKLDYLLDMIGELVIAESLVTQNPDIKELDLPNFSIQSSYLRKVVRNLQEVSLQLRMITLEGLFNKMERLVRDLAQKTGKKVGLQVTGKETEIDKNALEILTDPLVHIIRNCIDHGLETGKERLAKGKVESGHIKIEAMHSGNEVWIIISDDGAGLDRDRILKKAMARGLIKEGEDENLKDERIWDFIFQPGFSTSDRVTDISGRGVGLDIVRRNIAKINGDVEIKTKKDQGASFILKLPLTIAIIEGMVVIYNGVFYIIPTIDVKETLNLAESKIDYIDQDKKVIRFREQLIPVVSVERLLNHDSSDKDSNYENSLYVIIVEYKNNSLALVFDGIVGNQSVVIKPIPDYLKGTKGFSGCTILGSGNIGMILDIRFFINNYYKENKESEAAHGQ
ncbi:MAG: chemotaxis protein CheA [Leptospiraceae bacterium]|nr:chemotaxis protein CheA [Leptospiraceae bacterium]